MYRILQAHAFLFYSSSSALLFGYEISPLLIGYEIIALSSDVQQGDPLGPLLFVLAVDENAHTVGTPLSIWYLDEITMGGPCESVIDSYPKIEADLSSVVREVNTSYN